MSEKGVKLPSNSKGKQASFFKDPAVDQLFSYVTMLTQELSVTYDRLETLERLLESKGLVTRQEIEAWVPDGEEETERTDRRDAMIERVFRRIHEEAEGLADPR